MSNKNSKVTDVVKSYSNIAPIYERLKQKPWKDFKEYLSYLKKCYSVPKKGLLGDFGGANGRNLLVFDNDKWEYISLDISFELLKSHVSLSNPANLINGDIRNISVHNNIVDLGLSIATLHHLPSKNQVIQALNEMYRVLKSNSFLIISVWRKWKKSTIIPMLKELLLFPFKKLNNKNWRHGDILIPWHNSSGEIITLRYYHLFTESELKQIIKKTEFSICDLSVLGGKSGADNFFLLLRKE